MDRVRQRNVLAKGRSFPGGITAAPLILTARRQGATVFRRVLGALQIADDGGRSRVVFKRRE